MTELEAIVVVIPARDEHALIGRCLESVARSIDDLASASSVRVVVSVVADGCRDSTGEIVSDFEFAELVQTPPVGVGAARDLGVQRGLSALGGFSNRVWIANTDADSVVGSGWLLAQRAAAESGADVRVGAVQPDFRDLTPQQQAAWTRTHRGGAARGHVHGANLGIRASTYLAAQGFQPVLLHEDVGLVQRATRLGATVVSQIVPDVITSGRSVSRVTGGYASYLNDELELLATFGR